MPQAQLNTQHSRPYSKTGEGNQRQTLQHRTTSAITSHCSTSLSTSAVMDRVLQRTPAQDHNSTQHTIPPHTHTHSSMAMGLHACAQLCNNNNNNNISIIAMYANALCVMSYMTTYTTSEGGHYSQQQIRLKAPSKWHHTIKYLPKAQVRNSVTRHSKYQNRNTTTHAMNTDRQ